jgi:hypothetical protein
MADRTLEDLMAALSGLLDDCHAIPHVAHRKYRAYPSDVLVEHDPRAAAACTYSHMVAEAERRWIGRSGVAFKEIKGMKVWIVGQDAVLRWKKMDEDGKARNYPTEQAKKYDRGDQFAELPPPAARLTVEYLLNPLGTEISRVQIARPQGKSIKWCVAVNSPGASARYEVVQRQFGTG